MQLIKKEIKIDEVNNRIWNSRYNDAVKAESDSTAILSKAEKSKYPRGTAYAKLNIAAAYFLQSKNDIALKNLSDALAWFVQNPSESGNGKALYLKANLFESFGDYEKALGYCLQSQKFSSAINDLETEAEAVSQLGMIYTRLCNFSKALDYNKQALKIREELNDENAAASSLNRIGMLMRLTKKHNESLEYYFKSLEIRKKNKQDTSIPWTLLGIASTYEDSGKTDEALTYFEQGMIGGDKRCTLQCMMGTGRIFSLKGDKKMAEERLNESLRFARELKAPSLIADAYSALAKHYESTGQPAKALKSYKLFQKTKESVQSDESRNRLRNVEISHAIEKSEQEKEIFRLKHVELKAAYDIIEEKNKDITASINYSSRIQRAILPKPAEIRGLDKSLFILYLPKDIVSGDFYWFSETGDKIVLVAGDCTGHGVPGALMSMLGISFLEEIVNNRKITGPGFILDALSKEVKRALHQRGETDESKDGMDMSISVIDKKKKHLEFSGAHNNLYLIRNNELAEYKADRMPVGYYDDADKRFSKYDIDILPGDMIYMFSDGYADQFGGPDNKKFKYSTLKELLLKIHKLPLKDQKNLLEREFILWRNGYTQVDDVLIMGMKL
jgi:serine phosphatase RsbU (regulator of sigma subunit)